MKKIKLFNIILAVIVALTIIMGQGLTHYVTAQQQKLTMVTSADYPPYEFRDTASGKNEIIGFDIDIAKNIAQELGYQLEIKDTDFNGIIPALQSGRADFAMARMTPTAERKKKMLLFLIFTTKQKIQLLLNKVVT